MANWLLLTLGLITFINRFAFLAKTVRFKPSLSVRQFLSYSSYAVLTAIWAPLVFHFNPNTGISIAGLDYLIAASLAAALAVFKVRSIFVVLASTALFFILRFLVLA